MWLRASTKLDVVTAVPRHDVIAVELSSFQLHYAPTVRPTAGVVLNVAEDHLDWHGSMDAYAADKARALTGEVAVAVVDDPGAAALLSAATARTAVGVTAGPPARGQLGVRDGVLVDDAFGAGALLPAAEIRPVGSTEPTTISAGSFAKFHGMFCVCALPSLPAAVTNTVFFSEGTTLGSENTAFHPPSSVMFGTPSDMLTMLAPPLPASFATPRVMSSQLAVPVSSNGL